MEDFEKWVKNWILSHAIQIGIGLGVLAIIYAWKKLKR